MSIETAPPIANVRYYRNRTPTNRPSYAKVKRGMLYYSLGNWREQNITPRGQWYGKDGTVTLESAYKWAQDQARLHEYTYTLMLSLRDGQMHEKDFAQAMQGAGHFDEWLLIQHRDTEHDHAHVIAFRHNKLQKQEFQQWKQQVLELLQSAERQALAQEQQLKQEQQLVQDQQLEQGQTLRMKEQAQDLGQGYGY